MSELGSWDRNLLAWFAFGLFLLLYLTLYFFPRMQTVSETEASIHTLRTARQEVAVLLPQVARTAFSTPIPEPDVRTWIANNALGGLDQNLVANDSYQEGRGSQVRLRRLQPEQAARFLSELTRVRLVIEKMDLQDSDQDGRWDLEISVRIPEGS